MPTLPIFPVQGGCLCGAVRYQITAPPLGIYNCHCKDCQRSSGAACSSSMPIHRNNFELLAGTTEYYDKPADSGRVVRQHACRICATRIFNEPLATLDLVVVRPGTLDDGSWAQPVGNIWTDSRAPWVDIDPDEPSFPGQPPSRESLFAAWHQRFDPR